MLSPDLGNNVGLHPRYSLTRVGLYVAQLNELGPIRIAFSRDIPMRIKRIQADCPSGEVRLLMIRTMAMPLPGVLSKLEPYKHPYGKDWYRCCPQVLRIIASL